MTYEKAVEQDPEGALCAFCGQQNDLFDEDGFFFLYTRPEMEVGEGEAACKACNGGEPGRLHAELHPWATPTRRVPKD